MHAERSATRLSHRIIARYLSVVLLTLESLGATAQTIAVSPPLITYAHTCRKKCVSACPVMRRRSRHIRIRSEQFEFVKLNAKKFDWRDTYHLILTPELASVRRFCFRCLPPYQYFIRSVVPAERTRRRRDAGRFFPLRFFL